MVRTSRLLRVVTSAAAAGALATMLVGAPTAESATTETATESVNVRSGPGTDYDVVGGLVRGQKVTATGHASKDWTTVTYRSRTAYVAARYLTTSSSLPATPTAYGAGTKITTAELNVRTGPGLSYAVVGRVAEGRTVSLTGKASKGYAEITYGGHQRWVSAQYLTTSSTSVTTKTYPRVATADLDIRTTPAKKTTVVTTVRKGTTLETTGATQGAYAQVVFKSAIRWVTARYLANSETVLPAAPPPVASSNKGATALAFAKRQLGKPYVFGAEGPNSYDCSGLTQTAWKQVGISLPRLSYDQIRVGTRVSKAQLRPGDLVFFYSGRTHVAMYVGNGIVIHAPRPGKVVQYIKMSYMPFNGASRPG